MPRFQWRGKAKTSSKSSTQETQSHENTLAALSSVIAVLDTTKDLVPIDIAKGVLSTLSSILTTVKNTMQNEDDFAEIIGRCRKMGSFIERTTCGKSEGDIGPALVRALSELKSFLDGIEGIVKKKEQRKLHFRFISASVDRESIAKFKEQLDSFLQMWDLELAVHVDMTLSKVDGKIDNVDTKIDKVGMGIEQILQGTVLMKLDEPDREPPPGPPAMFFGRDDLVRDAVETLSDHHVVLVGSGGIGKSTIAKAILNEGTIVARFQDRRFFVSFDNIDASQITLDTFIQRITDVLGVKSARLGAIRAYLADKNVLIVLDNAETFQEAASGSDRIAEAIDELGALPSVRIILTTRNRRVSTNLRRIVIDVPALDPSAARETFTQIYGTNGSPAIIDKLLKDLDFHALSINLLAHIATENQWTLDRLTSEWKKQQTELLEVGDGKLQNLSVTIELSLASSSIKQLGNDARHVMQVAAFLPQGINEKNLEGLFPTIPNIRFIIDALCRLSLMYRKTEAYAMLSPIRIHISNAHQVRDTLPLDLTHVRNHYYAQLGDRGAWITTEDANVERLIAHDFFQATAKDIASIYHACSQFLLLLVVHKPRPTSLRTAILGEPDCTFHLVDRDACVYFLGHLAAALRDNKEAINLFATAKRLFAHYRSHELTANCLEQVATQYSIFGNVSAAEQTLQEALNLRREYHILRPDDEARINLDLGDAMMHKGRLQEALTLFRSAREYFDSTGDANNIAYAAERQGEAEWHSGNYAAARQHFETRLDLATRTNNNVGHGWSLVQLARAEARDGNYMEARKLLEEAFALAPKGSDVGYACRILQAQAALASDQGHFDRARDILTRAFDEMATHGWQSAETIAMTNDCSARNELFAGDFEKAKELFLGVVDSSDEISDFELQTRSSRALGEIALLEGDNAGARKWFTKTKSLCDDTGRHPDFLYVGNEHTQLKEEHNGWRLFLEGRLPSA
ncbi:hypothetical protein BV22DRAFT_1134704 [Leucogyrophana mollusca]|uniref:Uncharacterized protein n=1 Tax=Leucogyrophana mollusca TaxID=85980 RepID=A0ACB8AYM1_9AGAM|nr:hypothetical protein BV22DRAFT_1134704 [Leucogyrophana mollusca]